MTSNPRPFPEGWIGTEATVTTCRYQFARMNTFTLGIQTQGKYRITFDYYAHGRLYSDELQSPIAIPQNQRIPLHYNPLNPAENDCGRSSPTSSNTPPSLLTLGIAGSVVLSFAWLLVLRSCH